jgi:hypothetical protein
MLGNVNLWFSKVLLHIFDVEKHCDLQVLVCSCLLGIQMWANFFHPIDSFLWKKIIKYFDP